MKETFKKVERDDLAAKEEYTTNLKNVSIDTSEIFERVAVHEPTAWLYVITRFLELNEGTIAPALRFTKNGGMDVEYKRLTMIQKTIENLLNMYPEIEIGDGEGMPYSSPRKIISDGEVKVENP
jgi:site-specific DNA-adenine methylase